MSVTLSLVSEELAPEDLQLLSRDLCSSLIDAAGIEAAPYEETATPAGRGDPITVGMLLLTFLTSGTAVAMMNVFKTYFARTSGVSLELTKEDGKKLILKADDVRSDQLDRTLSLAREFIEA